MHPLQFSCHGTIKDQSIPALESSLHLHTSAGWVGAMICNFIHPILPPAIISACLRQQDRIWECHLCDMSDMIQAHNSYHVHESQSNKVWGPRFRIAVRARMRCRTDSCSLLMLEKNVAA